MSKRRQKSFSKYLLELFCAMLHDTSFVRYECIYLNRMFKSVDEPNCCEQALKMLIKFDVTLKKPK